MGFLGRECEAGAGRSRKVSGVSRDGVKVFPRGRISARAGPAVESPRSARRRPPAPRPPRSLPLPDWFFTSDLHGQGALYEQLVALAAARQPRAVLIGGDLAPHAVG